MGKQRPPQTGSGTHVCFIKIPNRLPIQDNAFLPWSFVPTYSNSPYGNDRYCRIWKETAYLLWLWRKFRLRRGRKGHKVLSVHCIGNLNSTVVCLRICAGDEGRRVPDHPGGFQADPLAVGYPTGIREPGGYRVTSGRQPVQYIPLSISPPGAFPYWTRLSKLGHFCSLVTTTPVSVALLSEVCGSRIFAGQPATPGSHTKMLESSRLAVSRETDSWYQYFVLHETSIRRDIRSSSVCSKNREPSVGSNFHGWQVPILPECRRV